MDPADTRLVGFKRHLRAETVPAEAVYLISERGVTALSGSCIERLAPFLDGTHNVAQVTREMSRELPATEVAGLLRRLSEAGLLEFRPPPVACAAARTGGRTGDGADAGAAAFWSMAGLDAEYAADALGAATVRVEVLADADGVTGTDAIAIAAMCAESGLACDDGDDAAISLVLCEDYLDPRLREVNARHLASRRPWLLAKPSGTEAWIGPVFQPGTGPCWACMAERLGRNRDEAYLLRRILGRQAFPAAPRAVLPASRAVALRLAVLKAVTWLAGIRDEDRQAIYILDVISLRGQHHQVRRRPQCPGCGDPGMVAAQARRPLPVPVPRAVPGRTDDTEPSPDPVGPTGPGQVLAAYGHLVDPVVGIVPELRREKDCPPFQYAYVSGRNRAITASTLAGLKAAARCQSGGKGVTELEAKAGALCEAAERYCGTRHGDEAVVRGSLRDLGARAVHPASCLLFDQRQYADRDRWNAACAPFHWVPEPFDESAVISWTPVWSLLTGEQKLLPTAMLYYSSGSRPEPASVLADSNGCAAGATVEDAIVRGFLELVERDAVAIWWYNRTRQSEVRLGSFQDPWIAGLPGEYRRLGREIWALDVTSDLGIPVVAAISRRTGQAAEEIMLGFGAHPDPGVALRHALTELGQLLPGTADGQEHRADPHLAAWQARATITDHPYLLPRPGQAASPARVRPRLDLDDIRVIARRAGLDVLVLDQARPDIGMPVIKVIAPGLRHFWPRFAPGRLFDVPVRLGRLTRPTAYSELNPVPVYVLSAISSE